MYKKVRKLFKGCRVKLFSVFFHARYACIKKCANYSKNYWIDKPIDYCAFFAQKINAKNPFIKTRLGETYNVFCNIDEY